MQQKQLIPLNGMKKIVLICKREREREREWGGEGGEGGVTRAALI